MFHLGLCLAAALDSLDEDVGVGHETQKLLEVDLSITIVINCHEYFDKIIPVYMDFALFKCFLQLGSVDSPTTVLK